MFMSTYYTPNEREYFSLSKDIFNGIIKVSSKKYYRKNLFFHFYFLNKDMSLNIQVTVVKF